MNWNALGAIGEIVGAIAVILTLGYLTLQVRQNTAVSRAASHHAVSDALNQINFLFGRSTEISALWLKGLDDRTSLSAEQRWQFDSILRAYLHVCETMYFQANVGTGDRGIVIAEERAIRIVVTSNGGKTWWQDNPFGFSVEFRAYVDELVKPTPE